MTCTRRLLLILFALQWGIICYLGYGRYTARLSTTDGYKIDDSFKLGGPGVLLSGGSKETVLHSTNPSESVKRRAKRVSLHYLAEPPTCLTGCTGFDKLLSEGSDDCALVTPWLDHTCSDACDGDERFDVSEWKAVVDVLCSAVQSAKHAPDGASSGGGSTWMGDEFALVKNEHAGGLRSVRHCIGDDLSKQDGWKHASCYYRNVCLNVETEEFLFYGGSRHDHNHDGASDVSLGALNPEWVGVDQNFLRWAPKVVNHSLTDAHFYAASNDTVWVPHHPMNGSDLRHVLWDDFLPWVTLKNILFLPDAAIRPLQLRVGKAPLAGTCQDAASQQNAAEACVLNYQKWLPLVTSNAAAEKTPTIEDLRAMLGGGENEPAKSALVCFPKLVAGYSMLTDHCLKTHGWNSNDPNFRYKSCNHGFGRHYVDFKNHMLASAGIDPRTANEPSGEKQIVIHVEGGAGSKARSVLRQLTAALKDAKGAGDLFTIVSMDVSSLPPLRQLELISHASAIVTTSGESTYMGMFLPQWSNLYIIYEEDVPFDWELWSNAAHLRVHWFALRSGHDKDIVQDMNEAVLYDARRSTNWP